MNYLIHSFLPFCLCVCLVDFTLFAIAITIGCAVDHQQPTCLLHWLPFDRHRRLFNLWAVLFLKIENTQSLVYINIVILVVVVAKLEQYLNPNVHIKTVETLRSNCDIFNVKSASIVRSIYFEMASKPTPSLSQPMQFFWSADNKRTQHS